VKRPIGITIIAVIQAFVGIVLLIGAAAVLLGKNSDTTKQALAMAHLTADTGTLVSIGIFALILAAIQLILAVGLFQLQGWAWAVTLFVFGADVVTNVIDLVNGRTLSQSEVFGVIISLLIVLYLLAPGVRAAFFRGASAHA
jgi:uncharacterized membrane protein (DUF2068 family)